jgi:acetyl esterase/lipase
LRAHAGALGIDPDRIGAWGSSGGGTLVALLGLAGPEAGFDHGPWPEQASGVQAVVDMFGPAGLTLAGGSRWTAGDDPGDDPQSGTSDRRAVLHRTRPHWPERCPT